MAFDFSGVVRNDLPPPNARWTGFPEFNFVGGNNDEASVPVDALRAAADAVLAREGENLGTYWLHSGPLGYLPLRKFLVGKLKKYAGIETGADDILLTSGSLQAIDLINRVFVEPGDTVILEESNYGGVLSRLNKLGVNTVTIPLDEHGMRMDALEDALDLAADAGQQIKYIYTIPTVHNPTGTILPLDRRQKMLELAKAHGVPIFEDECYADLIWSGERPPAIRALDDSGLVMLIGSFSKCIAPALRVGFVSADWEVLSRLLSVKGDAGSGALEQMVLAEYCTANFDDHVTSLNKTLEGKLDNLIEALNESFGTSVEFTKPPGGIFLWVKLPDGVDTSKLAGVAGGESLLINPGAEWSLGADASSWIRICYAGPPMDTMKAGIAKLADICHREFGVPTVSANVTR